DLPRRRVAHGDLERAGDQAADAAAAVTMRKRDTAGREIDPIGAHQVLAARVELDRVLEENVRVAARQAFARRRVTEQLPAQDRGARVARDDPARLSAGPRLALGHALLARAAGHRHTATVHVQHAVLPAERAAPGGR